ncbi:MAG: hypothetical protein M1441_02265 [Candidatus Parvarchaeota archaeon]|nr:hypothetical protein [Candidatus Parvarchaeota archaeon]
MIKLLLDTNILVYAFKNGYDLGRMSDSGVYGPYELYTLDLCINELRALNKLDVVRWVQLSGIKTIKTDGSGKADDRLLEIAKERDMHLLTEDRELYNRALGLKVHLAKIESGRIYIK